MKYKTVFTALYDFLQDIVQSVLLIFDCGFSYLTD